MLFHIGYKLDQRQRTFELSLGRSILDKNSSYMARQCSFRVEKCLASHVMSKYSVAQLLMIVDLGLITRFRANIISI